MDEEVPVVFISYSHDSDEHKLWVHKFSSVLNKNGIETIIDLETTPGCDLNKFMERIGSSRTILCILSQSYIEKIENKTDCGAYKEYSHIVKALDNNSQVIIPILRNIEEDQILPELKGKKYSDFSCDDTKYYVDELFKLIKYLHGENSSKDSKIGKSPFSTDKADELKIKTIIKKSTYFNPYMSGHVEFNYSENSGHFSIGEDLYEFETYWSNSGNGSIHALKDYVDIIGYTSGYTEFPIFSTIDTSFEYTSRHYTPKINEIVVWVNKQGKYAATKILEIVSTDKEKLLIFDYKIYYGEQIQTEE